MITGEIKNKLDNLWDAMWSNQMTNPWIDIQQVTYLIFIKMLDDNQIKIERKINSLVAAGMKVNIEDYDLIFKDGFYIDDEDKINCSYADLRWSVFSAWGDNGKKFDNLKNNVFPFIKKLHGDKATSFARYMEKAEFAISNPYILGRMIEVLSDPELGFNKTDMMGDCYEYLLSKMATSGDNGQFRTPRHIIDMMVEIAKPTLQDTIIDPAIWSGEFFASVIRSIKKNYSKELMNKANNKFFQKEMFTAFDSEDSRLLISYMNMYLNGIENSNIEKKNPLTEDYEEHDKYSLILGHPLFNGKIDASSLSKSLIQLSGGTKKTELLFLFLYIRLLKTGGRCVSIIPVGVLNNTNDKAYNRLRKALVEEQKLEGIIFMPGGVLQPYSGVQTGILIFTKTNAGGTDKVWMYNMEQDGYSLDQKRDAIEANDIPDIISRWNNLSGEAERTKYEKSFLVDKQEIVDNDYVFSFNKYQKKQVEKKTYRATKDILSSINELEMQFKKVMEELGAAE